MSGYVIAQIDLKSKEGYKEYADKVPDTVKNFGGEYLVRAGEFKSLEGVWNFKRNVIIKFPSYEKALEWYNSKARYDVFKTANGEKLSYVPISDNKEL